MEIKTTNEIVEWIESDEIRSSFTNENGDWTEFADKCQGKEWIAVDDLIERIETICNHGNERDMKFRKLLLKHLNKEVE